MARVLRRCRPFSDFAEEGSSWWLGNASIWVDTRYRVRGSPWECADPFDQLDGMSLMMLNIGMYSAITAAPTQPPMTAIRSGSIRDVNASTDASTSAS